MASLRCLNLLSPFLQISWCYNALLTHGASSEVPGLQPSGYCVSPRAIQCQPFLLLPFSKLNRQHPGSLQQAIIDSLKKNSKPKQPHNVQSGTTVMVQWECRGSSATWGRAVFKILFTCIGNGQPAVIFMNVGVWLNAQSNPFLRPSIQDTSLTMEDPGSQLRSYPLHYSCRIHFVAFSPLIRKWHNPVLLLRSLLDIYPVPKGTLGKFDSLLSPIHKMPCRCLLWAHPAS